MEIKKYIEKIKNKNNESIRAIAFNMQNKGKIDIEQIDQLKLINADIMLLTECQENINKKLRNYLQIASNKSHCGYMKIFVHKKICDNTSKCVLRTEYINGCILCIVKTLYGKIILGTMHLPPSKNGSFKRKKIIEEISTFCNRYDYPCIIGGDTNMRDFEDNNINDFEDAWYKHTNNKYYLTYPNRNYDDKYSKIKPVDVKFDFRFDRFFMKRCNYNHFRTIDTGNSDHMMITVDVEKMNGS